MNTLDIIILIVLLIGGLNGLRQGFVKALANLVGWIFALILAAKYANILAPMMSVLSQDPVVQKIAAFAAIVLLIVVMTWIVGALLNSVLKSLKLGPLNRLVGGAFGGLKGLFVVLVAMQGLGPWVESSPYWRQSKLVQTLLPYAPLVTEMSKNAADQALKEMKSEGRSEPNRVTPEVVGASHEHALQRTTQNPFS